MHAYADDTYQKTIRLITGLLPPTGLLESNQRITDVEIDSSTIANPKFRLFEETSRPNWAYA